MAPSVFLRDSIKIEVPEPGGRRRLLLSGEPAGARVDLPAPGVYSLSGPNQSGKTTLIKYLMGIPPLVVKGYSDAYTFVDGEPYKVRHVADAHARGLVAVFHDDELIQTMTLGEQLLMRHTPSRFRRMAGIGWEWVHGGLIESTLKNLFPNRSIPLPPKKFFYPQDTLLARANEWLQRFGFGSIMTQFPREMSTGARAAARILLAILHKRIRVLFLDEALAGVEARTWPRLVEALQDWQQQERSAIVVITHNREELIRWAPTERFAIEDTKLAPDKRRGYSALIPGMPSRTNEIPIYEGPFQSSDAWFDRPVSHAICIVDQAVQDHVATKEVLDALSVDCGQPTVVPFHAAENEKDINHYVEIARTLLAQISSTETGLVVIGGGIALNLAGFVAATIYRGRFPFVFVPTTIMAVGDVAIGGKTAANLQTADGSHFWKHGLGVYANPTSVLLDDRYADSLTTPQLVGGLAESLKHGLLQDKDLFESVLAALLKASVPREEAWQLAKRTLVLKSQTLGRDPWEEAYGRLLLYGHLHAHSLERATTLRVPHGSSVFFGILMELALAGNQELFDRIVPVVRTQRGWLTTDWFGLAPDVLSAAYREDIYGGFGHFSILDVAELGCYNDPFEPLSEKTVTWEEIAKVYHDLEAAVTN
jgi:3-dehydroquinate synthetase/ABC-type branched-subunit amino acid transport system ATPase component